MQTQPISQALSSYHPIARDSIRVTNQIGFVPSPIPPIEQARSLQGRLLDPIIPQAGAIPIPYGKQIRKLINTPYTTTLRQVQFTLTGNDLLHCFKDYQVTSFGSTSESLIRHQEVRKLQLCIFVDEDDIDLQALLIPYLKEICKTQNAFSVFNHEKHETLKELIKETPLLTPKNKPFGKRVTIGDSVEIKVIFEAKKLKDIGIVANFAATLHESCLCDLRTGEILIIEGNTFSKSPQKMLETILKSQVSLFFNPELTPDAFSRLLISMQHQQISNLSEVVPIIFSRWTSKYTCRTIVTQFLNRKREHPRNVFHSLMQIISAAPLSNSVHKEMMEGWIDGETDLFNSFARMACSLPKKKLKHLFSCITIRRSVPVDSSMKDSIERELQLPEFLKEQSIPSIDLNSDELLYFNTSLFLNKQIHVLNYSAAATEEQIAAPSCEEEKDASQLVRVPEVIQELPEANIDLTQQIPLEAAVSESIPTIDSESTSEVTKLSRRALKNRNRSIAAAAAKVAEETLSSQAVPKQSIPVPSFDLLDGLRHSAISTPAESTHAMASEIAVSSKKTKSRSKVSSAAAAASATDDHNVAHTTEVASASALESKPLTSDIILPLQPHIRSKISLIEDIKTIDLLKIDHTMLPLNINELNTLIGHLMLEITPSEEREILFRNIYAILKQDKKRELLGHKVIWDFFCAAFITEQPPEFLTLLSEFFKQSTMDKKKIGQFIQAFKKTCLNSFSLIVFKKTFTTLLSLKLDDAARETMTLLFKTIVLNVEDKGGPSATPNLTELIAITKTHSLGRDVIVELMFKGRIQECWKYFFQLYPSEQTPIVTEMFRKLNKHEEAMIRAHSAITKDPLKLEAEKIQEKKAYAQVEESDTIAMIENISIMLTHQKSIKDRAMGHLKLIKLITEKYIIPLKIASMMITPHEGLFIERTFTVLEKMLTHLAMCEKLMNKAEFQVIQQTCTKILFEAYISLFLTVPHESFKFTSAEFLIKQLAQWLGKMPQDYLYSCINTLNTTSHHFKALALFSEDPLLQADHGQSYFNQGIKELIKLMDEVMIPLPPANTKSSNHHQLVTNLFKISLRALSSTDPAVFGTGINTIKICFSSLGASNLLNFLSKDRNEHENRSIFSLLISNPYLSDERKIDFIKNLTHTAIESEFKFGSQHDQSNFLMTLAIKDLGSHYKILECLALTFPSLQKKWRKKHQESPFAKPQLFAEFLKQEYSFYRLAPPELKSRHPFHPYFLDLPIDSISRDEFTVYLTDLMNLYSTDTSELAIKQKLQERKECFKNLLDRLADAYQSLTLETKHLINLVRAVHSSGFLDTLAINHRYLSQGSRTVPDLYGNEHALFADVFGKEASAAVASASTLDD